MRRYFKHKLFITFQLINFFDLNLFFLNSSGKSKRQDRKGRQMVFYSLYGFGVPALLTAIVSIIDLSSKLEETEIENYETIEELRNHLGSMFWRPGFGESSCWFSSCSSGLLVYLYV